MLLNNWYTFYHFCMYILNSVYYYGFQTIWIEKHIKHKHEVKLKIVNGLSGTKDFTGLRAQFFTPPCKYLLCLLRDSMTLQIANRSTVLWLCYWKHKQDIISKEAIGFIWRSNGKSIHSSKQGGLRYCRYFWVFSRPVRKSYSPNYFNSLI